MPNPNPNPSTRFKSGQSGNPGGMVPGTRSITSRLRELLEKDTINGQPIKDGKQVADLVAEVVLKSALMGDHRFVTTLLDRTEGKVSEPNPAALLTDDELLDQIKKSSNRGMEKGT